MNDVAAVARRLARPMLEYEHFSEFSEKWPDFPKLFENQKAYESARGKLTAGEGVGWLVVMRYLGDGKEDGRYLFAASQWRPTGSPQTRHRGPFDLCSDNDHTRLPPLTRKLRMSYLTSNLIPGEAVVATATVQRRFRSKRSCRPSACE
jgi:hypothetical protein